MVPANAQVVCCVTDAVGVAGAFGGAFTVTGVAEETQPETVFFTVTK
jgi:hypothetical protein